MWGGAPSDYDGANKKSSVTLEAMLKSLVSYGVLIAVLGVAGWLTVATWRLYVNYPEQIVYFEQREVVFERHPTAYLVPSLDVKRYLAARWPRPNNPYESSSGRISKSETEKTTLELKSAIYTAFFTGNFSIGLQALKRVSWRNNPAFFEAVASVGSSSEPWPDVWARRTNFDLREVVEALDATWLLSAFLLDRMGETTLAQRNYNQYVLLLSQVEEPGADRSDFHLSRRKSAVRARLQVLEHLQPRTSAYDQNSYFLTLIALFLQKSLIHPAFQPYKDAGLSLPDAAQQRSLDFPPGSMETIYKLPERASHLEPLSLRARAFARLERCAFLAASPSSWKEEDCEEHINTFAAAEGVVLPGLVVFKAFRIWVQDILRNTDSDYWGEPISEDKRVKWVSELRIRSEVLRPLLVNQNGFLLDDLIYWKMNALEALNEKKDYIALLCELAKFDPEASDFSHVARFQLKVSEVNCL